MNQLDIIHEERDIEDVEVRSSRDSKSNLWHLLKVNECYAFQKARIQWIKEGDENAFFCFSYEY